MVYCQKFPYAKFVQLLIIFQVPVTRGSRKNETLYVRILLMTHSPTNESRAQNP